MPPPITQKGLGKKGRDRQSRSRNTTPSLVMPPSTAGFTALLDLPTASFSTPDDLQESYGGIIPSSQDLEALLGRLKKLVTVVEERGQICDKGMRMAVQATKDRRDEAANERREVERKEQVKRDLADEEERGRKRADKVKKRKDNSTAREERPLAHGAHGLAPQDGSNLDRSSPPRDKTHVRNVSRESGSSSLSPVAPATPAATGMEIDEKEEKDDDSSSDERQPPPAAPIPHQQMFGDDPSTFPDSTVYEIRKVTKDMTDDEKKEIYSVARFPHDDLESLIAGSPPDKDYSNAKPSNQVQANTFQTYLDPYFRPFTEEDLAFLRERIGRGNSPIVPRRGKKSYQEIWQEKDGALSIDQRDRSSLPLNQPRGSIDLLTDDIAETDQVSAGPMLSRLLATLRPEHRAPVEEKPATNGSTNGEVNGNGEANNEFADLTAILNDAPAPIPSATFMTDSNSEAWKKAQHTKLDYAQVDERIKHELRYIGFLGPDSEPDYDGHLDDEIAARLRYLQKQLEETAIKNGARKARLMELTKERMANQEFNTILEDLDSQVQTAYLKRTRTLGKSKKNKRPGGAGGGSHFTNGVAVPRPAIGDITKMLMERRSKWINTIGGVLDTSANEVRRSKDPGSSIFKPEDMAELLKREREGWFEDGDED